MNFRVIFESVFRRDIDVFRLADGTVDNAGNYTPGAETPTTIKASCQPAKPEDVQLIPPNRRNDGGHFTLYSKQTLNVIDGKQNPDQIEINGDRYEVFESETWGNDIVSHKKYLTVKVVSK